MKKNVWIMMLLIIISSFSMKLVAQEGLDSLVKKCEAMKDVSIIHYLNSKSKSKERKAITQIIIKSNQMLIDKFIAEIDKKEEGKVYQITAEKTPEKSKKTKYYLPEKISYSISYGEKEGYAEVTVIKIEKLKINTPAALSCFDLSVDTPRRLFPVLVVFV